MPAERGYADLNRDAREAERDRQDIANRVAEDYRSYAEATQLANLAAQRAMTGADIAQKVMSAVPHGGLLSKGMSALTGYSPRRGGLQSAIDLLSMPGVGLTDGYVTAPTPTGFIQQGGFGNVTFTGMPDPTYTGPFSGLVNPPPQGMRDDGQRVVPAVSTPMGNTCPPGYEFDDTLQACIRVSPGLQPAPFTPMQYRLPETGLLDFPVSNMGATLI